MIYSFHKSSKEAAREKKHVSRARSGGDLQMFSRVCKEIYINFYFENSFLVPLTVRFKHYIYIVHPIVE